MEKKKKDTKKKFRHEKYIKVQEYKGNYYFTVQFQYETINGKEWFSKSFNSADYKTPNEALTAACNYRDKKRAEFQAYSMPSASDKTIQELWDDYCRIHKKGADGRRVEQWLASYILELYGNRSIKRLRPSDIIEHLESNKYDHSQKVLSGIATTWRKITKQALMEGIITRDLMELVVIPESEITFAPRTKVCSDADVERVISALSYAPGSQDQRFLYQTIILAIRVMSQTGLRPGECYSLMVSDIDFDANTITVRSRAGKDEAGNVIRKRPKTKNSVRTIPMNELCRMDIEWSIGRSGNDYLFTYADGSLLDSTHVSKIVNKMAKEAGVKFNLYMLRHNVASTLITSNVDPRTVMELLGHSNANTTIGTYARSNNSLKSSAVERLVEKGKILS